MEDKNINPRKTLNFLNKYYNKQDKKTRLLIILSSIGLIIFLVLATTLPVKDKLLSLLYPKPKAQAALSYYGNTVNTFGLFGQKNISSATRQSVTANAAYHGSGVIVDTSSTPNKIYFVDSGNNRILGFNGGDGTAKPADIVIGQPDFSSGNCNGDDNLGYKRAPTAATLCLLSYPVGGNTAEQWGAKDIDVDLQGNLYVPDHFNDRVLEYYQPFSADKTGGKGDSVADFVYGQPDFTSNGPNGGSTTLGEQNPPVLNPPTNSSLSLCCGYGPAVAIGVSVDPFDNGVWIADHGNHRIMHFPQGNHTADVILGQPGCDTDPNSTTNMCAPILAKVNPDNHELYVVDQWRGFYARFMVFKPDLNGRFQTGQAASRIFKPNVPLLAGTNDFMFDSNGYIFKSSGFVFNKDKTDYPTGLIWVNEHERNRSLLLDESGNVLLTLFAKDVYHNGGDSAYSGCPTNIYQGNKVSWPNGSIGQDSTNNLYFAGEAQYVSARVIRYALPYLNSTYNGTVCPPDGNASLLQGGWNLPSNDTLGESLGLAVFGNQLIVQDQNNTRKVWNDYTNKSLGAASDIALTGGMSGRNLISASIDDSNRLWTYGEHGEIRIYQLPFTGNNLPIADFVKLYWADNGSEITYRNFGGIAFDKINKKMYFVDTGSRILRVSNYNDFQGGKLLVDMVIGQTTKTNTACNQGLSSPTAQTLCQAYQIKFDNLSNLYVVDDNYECQGNRRITVFMAGDLQSATTLFPNLSAKKVFNEPDFTSTSNCSYWVTNAPGTPVTLAFNGKNQLVIANDGSYGDNSQRELKQLWFYADPLNKQTPDASINLYMGAPGEITFDSNDNLLIQDGTWYRVTMINLCSDPSWLSWLPGTTPVSTCTPSLTGTPSPTLTPSLSPTPTPTPSPTTPPAQNYGSISGTVYSSAGGIVAGAKITTRVGKTNKTFYSNSLGVYSITNLPPGTYTLTFQVQGYVNQKVSASVTANTNTTKNVTLVKR